jgi:CRISPR/Cas system-associated exonuclease Cas4 (RecB family)
MPKINKPDKKTGIQTVSRSKCSTTKALYLEAIKSVNGDPEDYADHIASIVDKQYFSRFSYKPTYDEYKSWLDMFEAILDDYNYTLKQGIYPYPSPSFMCSYCPFEGVCISGDSPFEATRYKNTIQLLMEVSQ